MKQHNFIVVYITARDSEEAEKIARQLLKRRQAACANIVPGVSSHFWWQNRLDSAQECLLVAKTKDTLLPDIVKSVRKIHSYGVPEIIALPIVGGSQEYLDWIDSEVT
jgi:periplasmic divalent cation tolerance protein